MKFFRWIYKNAIAFISMGLLLLVAIFVWVMVHPLDVLQDWTYTIERKDYVAGDTIIVTTQFRKVRNVTGIAKRYIVCETPNRSTVRLPIGETNADRPSTNSTNVSDIYLRIPDDIPFLPTLCEIQTTVEYNIYSFRKFTEYNHTGKFKVLPPAHEPTDNSPITQNSDNDNEVVENSHSSVRATPNQISITQQNRNNQGIEGESGEQPSRLERIVNTVTSPVRNLLGRLVGE